jgi:hypothetical protein
MLHFFGFGIMYQEKSGNPALVRDGVPQLRLLGNDESRDHDALGSIL